MSGVRSCCRECLFEVDDCNRRDAATLDVPAPMSPLESMPPHHSPCRPCSCDFLQLCHFQGPILYSPQLLSCPGLSGCVWQCISALITIVMKASFSGGAGRGGGECCLLHHQRADLLPAAPLLIFPSPGRLMLVRAAASCSSSAGCVVSGAVQPPDSTSAITGRHFCP